MATAFVIVHIEAKDETNRSKLLKIIDNIIAFAKQEEGVLQYIVCELEQRKLTNSIYLIEEYATEALRQSHLASDPVKVLLAELAPESDAIASPPEIHVLPPTLSFQRTNAIKLEQVQLVLLSKIPYGTDSVDKTLNEWKKERDQLPSILAYTVLDDVEKHTIHAVQLYSDSGLVDSPLNNKSTVLLKAIAGFVAR